ncbi:MAG TPA: hypothetical protein VLE99_03015 [Candidatus Saccharimonadales bacterium]|nr:hypothetical protein [Candidatus Saccharimonadales bacterium]
MTAYRLTVSDRLLTDGTGHDRLLHDVPTDEDELYTAALVASGDYFAILAATLEEIAESLPSEHSEQYRLEFVAEQLFYLQQHYRIAKKPPK